MVGLLAPSNKRGGFAAMRKQEGFSLIELLIVVAIILIIAAIAIPSLIRARVSANESAAAANTRTIITAEIQYHTTFAVYSPDLTSMGTPASGCATGVPPSSGACLLDFALSNAGTNPKSGYLFTASATNAAAGQAFVEGASPSVPGLTGVKSFCGTDDGVIRYNPNGGPVTANCSTLSMIGN
jgi:type IV pilus assembly protein PilA